MWELPADVSMVRNLKQPFLFPKKGEMCGLTAKYQFASRRICLIFNTNLIQGSLTCREPDAVAGVWPYYRSCRNRSGGASILQLQSTASTFKQIASLQRGSFIFFLRAKKDVTSHVLSLTRKTKILKFYLPQLWPDFSHNCICWQSGCSFIY